MLGAVILGAGLSKRMGQNKMLLPLGKTTVLAETLTRVKHKSILRSVVILSRVVKNELEDQLNGVEILVNETPENGQSTSLKLGSRALLRDEEIEAMIVFLGDQPFISFENIDKAIKAWEGNPQKIVCLRYKNQKGHPTILGKSWMKKLSNLTGDYGARELIKANPQSVLWIEGDETCVVDLDTPEDYEKFKNKDFLKKIKMP